MADSYQSTYAGFPDELTATMTGAWVSIGELVHNPIQIIFDNQGTEEVSISVNAGSSVWRTFPAGEALVLDMRGNHGIAASFTMYKGTIFHGNGISGVFSISYLFAL